MRNFFKTRQDTKYAVIINLLIIIAVAFIGIWIVYFSLAIFTKHGEKEVVPGVENMSYTEAINVLHKAGFNVEIRDSVFRDDVKPGYVIEQFPKSSSVVKPGRKIFLYINAVHPKEVVVDDSNNPTDVALKGWSYRQAMARLNELGFKNIQTVTIIGEDDRVAKVTANGKIIKPLQKVPVNAAITIMVNDGSLSGMEETDLFQQIEEFLNSINGNKPAVEITEEPADSAGSSEGGVGVYEEGEYEEPEYF